MTTPARRSPQIDWDPAAARAAPIDSRARDGYACLGTSTPATMPIPTRSTPTRTSLSGRWSSPATRRKPGAGYLSAVLVVLGPWQGLAFVGAHQALFGLYMGCSFAPNHKGMPVLTGEEEL